MSNAILRARELLGDLTPLKTDCGRLCGGACCQGDEQTGMLLFPGEERSFENCDFGRVIPANFSLAGRDVQLFVCSGHCRRESRPLACRLFPLFLRFRKDGSTRIRMDSRAFSVCPLCGYGMDALHDAFISAARCAYDALLEDADCAAFLKALDDELRL